MRIRTTIGIAILCIVMLGSACSAPKWYIWIINPVDISHIVFGLGSEAKGGQTVDLYDFEVLPCSERAMTISSYTRIRTQSDEKPIWKIKGEYFNPMDRLVYSVLPSSKFKTVVPPQAIKPAGCYLTRGTGSREMAFRTDTLGNVRQLSESEMREMYDWWDK